MFTAQDALNITQGNLKFKDKKIIWELTAIDQLIRSRAAAGESYLVYTLYQGNFPPAEHLEVVKIVAIALKENSFKIGKLALKEGYSTVVISWSNE